MEQTLEIGKIYDVEHSRKGRFTIQLTNQSEDFAQGTIIEGKTITAIPENARFAGEEVQLRKSFCNFKLKTK